MKKNLTILAFILAGAAAFGQDTIAVETVQNNEVLLSLSKFKNMNDDEIDDFFAKNVGGDIYDTFHSGMNLSSRGKKLFIPGIILTGAGIVTSVSSFFLAFRSNADVLFLPYAFYYIGMAASVVGEGLIIASIPIRAIGGAKKRNAKNNYIEQYLKGSSSILQPSLNFGLTASGVGFTVNF